MYHELAVGLGAAIVDVGIGRPGTNKPCHQLQVYIQFILVERELQRQVYVISF